jgi:hypothetical protein
MTNKLTVGDELKDAELGALLKSLGIAVASTNAEVAKAGDENQPRMVINKGSIKLNLALNIKETREIGGAAGLAIGAFNVNASYKSVYGYDQSGSCEIVVEFAMVPLPATPAPAPAPAPAPHP